MSLQPPPNATWVERESFIEAFESAYAADPNADFAAFVPPDAHPLRLPVLEELVRIDLEHNWSRRKPVWLEDYFLRFPELFEASAAVRTLAFEEFRLRRQAGESVDAEEYQRRFGIDPTRGIRDDAPESGLGLGTPKPRCDRFAQVLADLPRVGDRCFGYRLVAELGAGAFGQVFLAEPEQGGGAVALKVSPRAGSHPPRLARFRHPHIMSVRAVLRSGTVLAVVMPYRGAVTLAHAQQQFNADSLPASGAALFHAVRPALPSATAGGAAPLRDRLAAASYTDAAIWLIARLADGLDHAHSRGLLHRDLKPANVLIADDGTPMLLDFNLATEVRPGETPLGPSPGGTLPYMAPEQLDEFIGNRRHIEARADLYALGVMLFQLLTGRMPYPAPHDRSNERLAAALLVRLRPAPLVRAANPAAPAAAEAIVRDLLHADPDLRPASAAVVRDSLQDLVPQLPRCVLSWRQRAFGWMLR